MSVAPRAIYLRDMYERLAARSKLIPMQPQCARKLVEGAVEYARNLGLAPARRLSHSEADLRRRFCRGLPPAIHVWQGRQAALHRRSIRQPGPVPARDPHARGSLRPDGYHYIVPVDEEAILPSLGEGDWGRIDAGTDRVVPPRIRFDEVREDS